MILLALQRQRTSLLLASSNNGKIFLLRKARRTDSEADTMAYRKKELKSTKQYQYVINKPSD